jgi:heat shock protein HtpX
MIVADLSLVERVAANRRRAVAAVLAVAVVVGVVVGLLSALVVAPVVALVVAVFVAAAVGAASWWGSEPFAGRLINAQPADPGKHARLLNLVEGLCLSAGLPQPALSVARDPSLNALTVGRDPKRARLVVTQGLLDRLSRIELEAVLAHELSHIKSYDTLPATVAVPLFGVFRAPAQAAASCSGLRAWVGYVLLPLSLPAGFGLRHAVGGHREELADLAGVSLTRYPPAMIAALEKLRSEGTALTSEAHPATAHLWLGTPTPRVRALRHVWLCRLFETHPPLDERIEALREL